MGTLNQFFKERVPVSSETMAELTNEPVPNHLKRWWFALGGTPAYLFVIMIVTGILLACYYQPGPTTAYQSVRFITEEVAFGWYIRSLHKWSATFMVAGVILHQMRVFFTGAYRRPRELNWMIGMGLLVSTLVGGFTGYSLVFEQLSYWGATVASNIADAVPLVGSFAKRMLLAGDTYNSHTLSRLFVIHAALMPTLMVLLLVLHIAMVRLHGVTEFRFPDDKSEQKYFNFIPDHLFTELIVGLLLMIVLSTLAVTLPAEMGKIADPLTTPEVIKPEWYFYVSFRWLKLFPATVAVLSMGLIVFLFFVWPFVDGLIRRRWPGSEASLWIGAVSVITIVSLTVWEAVVAH
ncbi:MAG TPA: cytochrome bc complex cytochrome b subunit [Pseudomonadota bacterium]|nr:cytochrome bc complex cytochrome b subunit [Pseudomonadota bacterium]HNF96783.1 cytochrome bc complex cytochrome b subunit [Pseudomonadota bacterium]HNK44594.1 cytochrome bc complex cytochrome b subunit [Pseudomonadota bacterium]